LDLPPGTGDVAISVAQLIPGAEILVVTTPQQAAAEVAERAGSIALQTRQRIVGVVENMSWLELPDGTRCDLARSPRSRGIVDALVAAFEARPGAAVAADALIAAAWPGDATPEPHRSNRLYVAVTRLRAQGLGDLVRHDGDGYLLDPAVVVARDGPQKT
ncbi:MAG: P-loop NTPase, partial [Myxococcales bacterium]|nr:P-loop NTPase [Myxococcales bacterium]